ncbi:hypothetical protein [Williamsia sp. CHRR-6]|uniref:hypothetical protein n=1 Tax=Williamsia sp. CHRR-6 TaxID=2835871 RepID=UPI001BDABFD9|nr:hypothetical protein [Williamsia sp. CHRR-6]MBT0567335.1 hypothetical protein [Williamsia sp. CHRR-6]
MAVTIAESSSPADWIFESDSPWTRLVTFGPGGFGAYARLRFLPDPEFHGQMIRDAAPSDYRHRGEQEGRLMAELCAVLADATSTPERCYFAVWSGYHGVTQCISGTRTFRVPNRQYQLYSGSVADAQSWADAPATGPTIFLNPPAMVWPADHAWFIACDTDSHWAGIGADVPVIARLVERADLDIMNASPWDTQPMYR